MELQDVEKLRLLELIGSTLTGVSAKEQAERLVDSINDERLRRYAESRLASLFVEVGDTKAAEEIAGRMTRTSRHSPAAFVLAKLAEKKATEDRSLALGYLRRAEEAAHADSDIYSRSTTQERVVRAYTSMGEWDHAQRVAREISVIPDRVAAMCWLAEKMITVQKAAALDLMASTAPLVEVAQREEQAELLDEIARCYLNLGERNHAHATWLQAASRALTSSHDTSQLLLGICMALTALGDKTRARDLACNINNQTRREQALAVTGGA